MIKVFFTMMACILMPLIIFSQTTSTDLDEFSYSVGLLVAENLKGQGIDDLDLSDFKRAMEHVFNGDSLLINKMQAQQNLQTRIEQTRKAQSKAQMEADSDFLTKNAKKEGVQTTASGLQYEVLEAGSGTRPNASDEVTVHYKGMLLDGTVFDSSYKRGQPASFPVNGVIQGWQEALQLMPLGSKYKLYIPQNLAYGERGAPPSIPPFAMLIFEVELLEIKK